MVSNPFNDSRYALFGNFIADAPPQFILMAKWWSIGRPSLAEANSAKLLVTIVEEGEKSKVLVTTKTNPAIAVFFALMIVMLLLTVLLDHEGKFKSMAACAILALGCFFADKFSKSLLFAGLERDLNLTKR